MLSYPQAPSREIRVFPYRHEFRRRRARRLILWKGVNPVLFGKHINRYYLRYAPVLFIGIVALVAVDYVQLLVPELYKMIINGMNEGVVEIDSVSHAFDMNFLLEYICKPMIFIILAMINS